VDTSRPALRIDREALVARHKVVLTEANPEHVLTVGNGDFAFSVDATGMQTFTQFHDQSAAMARSHKRAAGDANPMAAIFADPPVVNTATMSNWGWHEMPNPDNYVLDDAMTDYETARGRVSYPDRYATTPTGDAVDQFKAGAWLHVNPQRLDLGRVGLMLRESAGSTASTDPVSTTGLQTTK
jgi:hypothetical protein